MKTEPSAGVLVAVFITPNEHLHFYYLANQMAHAATQVPGNSDVHRYSIGAVIMSYTCIEAYFNQIFFEEHSSLRHITEGMSKDLLSKVERLGLMEKIELALRHTNTSVPSNMLMGREPYQSLDLIRQLRNLLIHHSPEEELVWSVSGTHLKESNIEKRISGRFKFARRAETAAGDGRQPINNRIFSRDCAAWSFNLIAKMFAEFEKEFKIPAPALVPHWEVKLKEL